MSLLKGFLSELCPPNRARKGYLVKRWQLKIRNLIQISFLTLFTQKILFTFDGLTNPNNYVKIQKCNYASNFIKVPFLAIYSVKLFQQTDYMSKGCRSEFSSPGLTRLAQFACSNSDVHCFSLIWKKISTRMITLPIRRYVYVMVINLN